MRGHVNICVPASQWKCVFISLGRHLREEFRGHVVTLCLIFEELPGFQPGCAVGSSDRGAQLLLPFSPGFAIASEWARSGAGGGFGLRFPIALRACWPFLDPPGGNAFRILCPF